MTSRARTALQLLPLAAALVALAAVAAGAGGAARARAPGCSEPLTYDVVRLDPQFHLSRAGLVALLERSEQVWEGPAGKNLLRYAPGGEVQVSLVYGERETAYLARQQATRKVRADDALIARLRASLDRMGAGIDKQSAEVETRQATLKTRVDYWNAHGGAPQKIYAELATEGAALHRLVASVNRQIGAARASEVRFNALVSARNVLAATVGAPGDRELGEARVGGTDLRIYVLTDTAKDVTLVAHEFGHILGLRHVPGAGNVMNPVLVKPVDRASAADLRALRQACAGS